MRPYFIYLGDNRLILYIRIVDEKESGGQMIFSDIVICLDLESMPTM